MLIYVCCVSSFLGAVFGDKTADLFRTQDLSKMSDRELVENLIVTVRTQQQRIDGLEVSLAQQNDIIRKLQQTIDGDAVVSVEPKATAYESSNSRSENLSQEGAAKRGHRSSRIFTRLASDVSPVAFSAVAQNYQNHLHTKQNIVSEITNINTANVYDPQSGDFVAPRDGVYVISASVMADQGREVQAEVVVNHHDAKARIFARGTDNRHDQGSQTILLHLNNGDVVSVRNYLRDDSVYGALYTSFSGFLLYEMDSSVIIG